MAKCKPVAGFKLDAFASIDYKKPVDKAPDYRTSTYLGTRYINDTMYGNKTHANLNKPLAFEDDPLLMDYRITDYKANYTWKFNDPNESRNPSLGNKILYMKPLFETKLKFLNRTMIPANSTTHSDYVWDPIPAPPPPVNNDLPLEIKVTPIVVDRSKPSYSKYLDPTATTNRLDYCYRSPQEIMSGIGAQDNITFWSWQKETHRPFKVVPEKDVQQCDKLPADSCVKRRAEYTSTLKHVPNSGMTTEVRENYLKPQTRMIDFNTTNIRNICVYQQVESSPKHTEYMLIGSGESTRKYI